MMKINIENLVNQAFPRTKDIGGYGYTLKELIKHLKAVKKAHRDGQSAEALEEFFELYAFNKKGE